MLVVTWCARISLAWGHTSQRHDLYVSIEGTSTGKLLGYLGTFGQSFKDWWPVGPFLWTTEGALFMFVDLLVRYVCKDLSARSLRSLWRGFLTSVRIRKSFNQYVPKTQIIYYIHLHSCRHRRGGDFTSPNFGLRSGYMKYIRLSLCTYIYIYNYAYEYIMFIVVQNGSCG